MKACALRILPGRAQPSLRPLGIENFSDPDGDDAQPKRPLTVATDKRLSVPPIEPTSPPLNLQQVRENAAAWLSRLQLGTADEEAFEQWRNEQPVHALEFARAFANWEAMRGVVNANDQRSSADPITRRRLLRIAAGGAALAIGGAFWFSRRRDWTRLATDVGKNRKVSLPDLSELELNTSTEVAWKLAQNRSVIQLVRGEISVTLRPGVTALFLSTDLVATLLSGQYNARYFNNLLRLTVIKGAALINDPARPTNAADVAAAGQTVTAAKGQSLKITTEPDLESTTAWRKGEIVFHDQPLVAAIAEYNRYLTKKIVIEAPRAERQPVGGRFTTTQPQTFLKAVSLSLDLQLTETADHYWLRPKT
jgi:transmembrane sensor